MAHRSFQYSQPRRNFQHQVHLNDFHTSKNEFGSYCWWFRNPANQLRLVVFLPLFATGFIHALWLFGISSINSIFTNLNFKSDSTKMISPLKLSYQHLREFRGPRVPVDVSKINGRSNPKSQGKWHCYAGKAWFMQCMWTVLIAKATRV